MPDSERTPRPEVTRRKLLLSSGAGAAAVALAGCTGGGDGDGDGDTGDSDTGDSDTGDSDTGDGDTGDSDTGNGNQIPQGGTLQYGLPEPADSHNYLLASSVYSAVANELVYDFGVVLDPITYEVQPWVFTDWEIQDPESDSPVARAKMRDDLVFNDGVEATADDMLFTAQFLNEQEPGQLTAWQNYESAEAADGEWDIRFTLPEPNALWETQILGGLPLFPEHIWSEIGDDWEGYDPWADDRSYQPGTTGAVGTGPGVLTQWEPDTSFEIEFTDESVDREGYDYPLTSQDWYTSIDDLTGNGPHLDRVQYLVYGEAEAMNQGLLNGQVDVIYESQTQTVRDAENDSSLNVIQGPDSGLSYANWNHRRPPLNDISLRQGMAMVWDEFFWTQELNEGFVLNGTVPYTPGYPAARPTAQFNGELNNDDPAINAFSFRAQEEGSPEPDVEAVRSFLENGEVIDGSEGTYAGKEYPGDISGVGASYSEAIHDYSFGSVESSLLSDADEDVDQELYVNGEPFSEFYGGPIEVLLRPPGDNPDIGEAWFRWASNCRKLGIPMRIQPTAFNSITNNVPYQADFDMFELGWGGMSATGDSLEFFFGSQYSNEVAGEDAYSFNANGYGNEEQFNSGDADDLIAEAKTTFDSQARNQQWASVSERAYLDVAYMTYNYDRVFWPHAANFSGAIDGLVDPPFGSWTTQVLNMYDTEQA